MISRDLPTLRTGAGLVRRGQAAGAAVIILAALAGCVSRNMDDLVAYVDQVKARKHYKIEPLPEIKVPEIYVYASAAKRDPFQPFVEEQRAQVTGSDKGKAGELRPPVHPPQELEQFPLDTLRMVGTLQKDDQIWGLITAPDGAVHRIQAGNYMGKNYGKITLIAEDHIELVEIIPNGQGGWQERPAKLELSE